MLGTVRRATPEFVGAPVVAQSLRRDTWRQVDWLLTGAEVHMAVGVQLDFGGATLEQYDRVNELTGLLPFGPAPRNELFHWVAKTDRGIRVIDVWESRDAFERFVHERLGPVFEEVGMPGPEIQFFEIHNYFSGARWSH